MHNCWRVRRVFIYPTYSISYTWLNVNELMERLITGVAMKAYGQ